MYIRMIYNDLRANKLVSSAIMLFIMIATTLVSVVGIISIQLIGSLNMLMNQAQVPDVLHMHQGEVNEKRMEQFANDHENVKDFQILDFLTIPGAHIQLGDTNLMDSVQDNGFSTQSSKFDYLLDVHGEPIQPKEGELYVPIGHMKNGDVQVGDKTVIAGETFLVAGFLRDAQMNSPLATSKRFLVHEEDYKKLVPKGSTEYLIEFRLKDASKTNEFETSYMNAGLEANGPSITKDLFFVINGLSDGVMIVLILFVGCLIIVIACMCIRFAILTKIEEDFRKIGTMKAIGLRDKDIKKMYIATYLILTAFGCFIGVILSFIVSDPLLENIRLYMGIRKESFAPVYVSVAGGAIIFLLVIAYVYVLLRRFKKISIATAIHVGKPMGKERGSSRFSLSAQRILPTNIYVGLKDVISRKRLYTTMLLVIVLSSFIMIIPWNTYQTISSPEFTKHIGFGQIDVLINMNDQNVDSNEEEEIKTYLENNSSIDQFVVMTSKSFMAVKEDHVEEKIIIELGEHDAFPIEYIEGKAPTLQEEIALSSMNASEFEKNVGDILEIVVNKERRAFRVTGIYSNVLNGGKTAKATIVAEDAPTMWKSYYIQVDSKELIEKTVDHLSSRFPFVKVTDVQQHKQQVFGNTISSIQLAAFVALLASLLITGLICTLFMRLLVAKDRLEIGILKAIGYTNKDISKQYATRSIGVLIGGVIIGSVLANTVGEWIIIKLFSTLGIEGLALQSHPYIYVGFPVMMLIVTLIATQIGTNQIGKTTITDHIKE